MSGLSTTDAILGLADAVLARVPDGEAEVAITETDAQLTRFAMSEIHQNVADRGTTVRLRLVRDGCTGIAEIRGGGTAALDALVAAALAARAVAGPVPDAPPLADARPVVAPSPHWDDATAQSTPEARAEAVGVVVAAARDAGLDSFGALSAVSTQRAVVSTRGVRVAGRGTFANLVAVTRGGDGAGYSAQAASAMSELNAARVGMEAAATGRRNQGGTVIDTGTLEVVLSCHAAAELFAYLGSLGFSALALQEGRSGVRLGEQQCGDLLTLVDDVHHSGSAGLGFDHEGLPTAPVTLVDRGVSRAVVHDSRTARIAGVPSTGHALPQPNGWGPVPIALVMTAGDAAEAELIAGVSRGLYVTRLWYIRTVHELRTVVTGMTREGTFLIEDGVITRPVRDLRFTQSILRALAGLRRVGSERRLVSADGAAVLCPALHLDQMAFTS